MSNESQQPDEIVREVTFAPGDHLFREGDSGGDLYFIETGAVEIYRQTAGADAILAVMQEGEVIGVLTCLTRDARLASARAKTDVTCKVVRQQDVVRSMKSLPQWIKIIIKEFHIRLNVMNEKYLDQLQKNKKLTKKKRDASWIGAQLAGLAAVFSEGIAMESDQGSKYVVVSEFVERAAQALNFSEEQIQAVFDVMLEAGMIRQEQEPDKKVMVVPLQMMQNLGAFQKFYNESRSGKKKKWVATRFRHRELETMQGFIKLLMFRKADMGQGVNLALADLHGNMQREIGVNFVAEALVLPKRLELIQIKKDAKGNRFASFHL